MSNNFSKLVNEFATTVFTFNESTANEKLMSMRSIAKSALSNGNEFLVYHQLLLFSSTHAENKEIYNFSQRELKRLATHLKKKRNYLHAVFADSGLPYTPMTTRYTQDAFNEMIKNKQIDIQLDSLNNDSFDLNTFLNLSLPNIIKEETTAGLDNDSLLQLMGVPDNRKFQFLLNEINNLKASPLVKDYLWQSLQSFFVIKGKHETYSKSFNRIINSDIYYTQKLEKHFDAFELLNKKLPKATVLSSNELDEIIRVIQNSMTLSMREIDPVTYMDKTSLQFYNLEHGLSMAIYGMVPERQLPLRSYVSYTLFKNGYPISYGGAWVFGKCALFALNIFEEFRGGESKYVMTQILRVYKQVFDICYFEVEPFQFGNEDALKTGAFWFYYKFGFRPIEKNIAILAKNEAKKIEKNKTYKSSHSILTKLAQGNIALHLNNEKFVHRNEILQPILNMIYKKYKGNHVKAINDAKYYFMNNAHFSSKLTEHEESVFEEIALWAFTFKITNKTKLSLMAKMITAKTTNYLLYNQLIQKVI